MTTTANRADAPARPTHARATYDAYHAWWTTGGRRGEWVDGRIVPLGPPDPAAARATAALSALVAGYVGARGACLRLPGGVELWTRPGRVRFPDLLLVLGRGPYERGGPHVDGLRVVGPPDLVAEVVDDASEGRDRVDKAAEYAALGVPEYWLVDPRPGRGRVDVLWLGANGRYAPMPAEEGRVASVVLPGLWLQRETVEVGPDALHDLGAHVAHEVRAATGDHARRPPSVLAAARCP